MMLTVNLLRAARSYPVTSRPPIVLNRRTSPHPIQRTRECGADGGEPIAGGVGGEFVGIRHRSIFGSREPGVPRDVVAMA